LKEWMGVRLPDFLAGGKSGLLQGRWFLTGTGSDTWKVPQKIHNPPLKVVDKGEKAR